MVFDCRERVTIAGSGEGVSPYPLKVCGGGVLWVVGDLEKYRTIVRGGSGSSIICEGIGDGVAECGRDFVRFITAVD